MTECPLCTQLLSIEMLKCDTCAVEYRGHFHFPALAALNQEEQYLVEMLILHGGNLKEIAKSLKISYPTLKKRLTELANSFQKKQEIQSSTL